jgi:hypothetical protein
MTGEGSGEASRVDEDPFEKQMRLTNETSANNSETQQHQDMSKHRLSINWRSGSKKNLFLICLMISSVRKASLNIGMVVCQGTLMSTKRTLMSLGCGDSSMVALHVEAG